MTLLSGMTFKEFLLEGIILTPNYTKPYRKGLKKHKHDKRVNLALKDIINNYLLQNKTPPQEYNVHSMASNSALKGTMSAHIKGQQVVLAYKVEGNTLNLLGLGSHRELGMQ